MGFSFIMNFSLYVCSKCYDCQYKEWIGGDWEALGIASVLPYSSCPGMIFAFLHLLALSQFWGSLCSFVVIFLYKTMSRVNQEYRNPRPFGLRSWAKWSNITVFLILCSLCCTEVYIFHHLLRRMLRVVGVSVVGKVSDLILFSDWLRLSQDKDGALVNHNASGIEEWDLATCKVCCKTCTCIDSGDKSA